jgi:hypothetical protein
VWLPPSQFEAAFLSTAHGEDEVRATIEAAREAFHAMGRGIAVSAEIEHAETPDVVGPGPLLSLRAADARAI